MTRTVDQAFEVFLSRLIPTDAQRAAGSSHRASVKAALEAALKVNNFFETGSFSHGTGVRGYSDIDALVSLGNTKPESSYTALNWIKDALSARFPRTTVVIRRPAVVAKFGGGYETWEVIPGFLTGRGTSEQYVYDIPGPSTGAAYIDSAPKEHLTYVNECNKKPHKGDAKDLARLIKAWKYFRNVPISSFYLEMRCAQHVATQNTYIHVWDVCQVLGKLESHELAPMNDPKGAAGRIYACSSDATRADALSKLSRAAARARMALEEHCAGRDATAFEYLDLLFAGKFPARVV
jgi:Second Messenger Oligonucleotide or Dinucleotide Synthetase domain